MSWTYSGNPAASTKDAVRFEIQDVFSAKPLLQDEEIVYALSKEGGEEPDMREVLSAAAFCAETLSMRFAAQADTVIGSIQATYTKQASGWASRAQDLRRRAQGAGGVLMPAASRSEKHLLRKDRDRVQPAFRRDQFKQHETGGREAEEINPGGLV